MYPAIQNVKIFNRNSKKLLSNCTCEVNLRPWMCVLGPTPPPPPISRTYGYSRSSNIIKFTAKKIQSTNMSHICIYISRLFIFRHLPWSLIKLAACLFDTIPTEKIFREPGSTKSCKHTILPLNCVFTTVKKN